MKIQLSTALLLFGLIAVCVGWVVDRQRWDGERETLLAARSLREQQIFTGAAVLSDAARAFDVFEILEDDPAYREYVQTQCVSTFFEIYENQDEIELAGELAIGELDARIISRDALICLGCEEAKRFFEIARSLKEFSDPDSWPELHDADSSEYKSLWGFVSATIDVKGQSYSRGFENDPGNK